MRIDKVHIKTRFKNLEDFQIDIDENAWETVLLGLNATGKSNFLEALVIIFRDLDLIYNHHRKAKQPFDYYIKYECRSNAIEITFEKGKYAFVVNGKPETTTVTKNIEHYLPKHIFIYYSGISDRLSDLYIPHQKIYYEQIIKECDIGLIVLDPRFTIPNFPSRILTFMEYAKPVLAATDKVTDIKDMIEEAQCGEWVWSGSIDSFISKIKEMAVSNDLPTKGSNGRRYIEENFTVNYSVEIIEKHLKQLSEVI